MSNTQTWFRTTLGDARGKWHAVKHLSEHGYGERLYAYCGFELERTDTHPEVAEAPAGELPVGTNDEPVCLHCQRALEMARREDDAE